MEYRTNEEMHIPAEYASRAEEYHTPAKETFEGSTKENEDSGKTSLFQKLSRIGYLVAASVAAVSIAQAAAPATAGTTVSDTTVSSPSRQIDFYKLDRWGSANGGVIPVNKGQWELMNLQGEIVSEKIYSKLCSNPNKDGYSMFFSYSDKCYYVLNNQGEEVFALDAGDWYKNAHNDTALITDDNIIYISFEHEYVGYWTIDGEPIYEATAGEGESIYASTPFRDGVAMVCWKYKKNKNVQELYMFSEDGTLTEVAGWESNRQTYEWRGDNYADGYILCYKKNGSRRVCLYNVETGEATPFIDTRNVNNDYLSSYEESRRYLSVYSMNNALVFGYRDRSMGLSAQSHRGTENSGLYLDHYGTYACLSASRSLTHFQEKGSVLFDFRAANSETESLNRVIAIYDHIQLDDFHYLCAKEGDDYFYIDYSGEVVSDTYAFATCFNDDGYAMVMDADGNAYLINDSFEKLDTITGCTAIESCGQAFVCMIDDRETLYVPAGY
jgi:hypothetical protein